MSKLAFRAVILGAVIAVLGIASYAIAGGNKHDLKAVTLEGYQENPDVATGAEGTFEATIAKDDSSISYELSYSGLKGTVTQAHIHFGKVGVNGGVAIWLCGTTAAPGPAGTQTCPAPSGTVTGVIDASKVVGPTGQGIAPGALADVVAAIRAGRAYANVHSTTVGTGEIRAQINDKNGNGND